MKRTSSFMPSIPLLICSLLFILIGIITIATASTPFAISKGFSPNYYLIHQVLFGFLPGIILGIIAFLTPLKFIKKSSLILFIISMILMFSVFIPGIGINEGGASRWINILGFSFQPSEFLKLTSILYLGAIFSNEKGKQNLTNFIVVLVLIASAFLFQKDLSTFVAIFAVCVAILLTTKTKLKGIVFTLLGGGAFIALMILLFPYRMQRMTTLFNPSEGVTGEAYQINQSLISIGSGGLNGSGLGLSAQKLGFVPEAMSDSIFTIYAEELGFLGCAFLIFLFIFFIIYSVNLAKKADPFGKFLTIGIVTWIVIQSAINIFAMSGFFPVTGIPLPFLSYGGTHLVFELIALGILLNISRTVNNNE
ncbi:MAG: FtsW/RodA/SpoVE family cell cycle protein [Candidatus Pacebacteria bacterium]|nr:FtsW/RodA/SpoVE family cell cycle protein [Candidatus Paceibacterota bacterium]MDD4333589.1 FtsW/RodA/SpoVE family cell cycle protein [Candidatus Paceibacterota bacterium]